MKVIVEFFWDCGRMGDLSGLFICDKQNLKFIEGKEVYFGEVLGKHSEISGTISADDFVIKTEDQEFIQKFIEIIGDGTISGYNPFDYVDISEDDMLDEELDEELVRKQIIG